MTTSQPLVVMLGATSSMARALAGEFANTGHALHLAGRNREELERIAADLRIRYQVPVSWSEFHAEATASHAPFWEAILSNYGPVEGVALMFGWLGDHAEAERDPAHAMKIVQANYTGAVSILTLAANTLAEQGHGFIIGCSSVAGDRGRPSNYVYGSAKGALNLFLQGLRARLCKAGVHVLTVKPGFVDTKMTYGKPGMFLVAKPETIAHEVKAALDHHQDVVYLPAFWWGIMSIIRSIPEPLFKRLKL